MVRCRFRFRTWSAILWRRRHATNLATFWTTETQTAHNATLRTLLITPVLGQRYRKAMAESKKLDLDNPPSLLDEEDEETLAGIDEGIRDADAGRIVSIEEVRKLLLEWT